ncbi:hypothetical protein R3P38DRAFT_3232896 [Favolaschia claudopus]|uniref:CCHC-type domain-containing protein n=1 Tax=Favolaschia claudopus TaxID=2862362 RepID=A0AAV9ZJE2_9AGAR
MLSLLRVRAVPTASALRRTLTSFSSTPLRTRAVPALPAAPQKRTFINFCSNCRREGHMKKDCKEPVICRACGVEGHSKKDCPNPNAERLEALKTAPKKCYRCGQPGHVISACPRPPTCFHCGKEGHIQKNCPTRPPLPSRADDAPRAAAAA